MKQIQLIKSTCKNFIYHITYKGNTSPRCVYPRETVTDKIRTFNTIYLNEGEEVIKYIKYPKELLFTSVLPDDPIENDLIEIKNHMPDWYVIDIIPAQHKLT